MPTPSHSPLHPAPDPVILSPLREAAKVLLEANACTPPELERRIGAVRDAHPGTTIDLAWERDESTGRLQADVLISRPGVGKYLLCFAAEDTQPWILRGAQHGTAPTW